MITFEIPGEPKSKLRHRTTKTGINYTPKKTLEYENWVKQCYCIKHKQNMLQGEVRAEIRAYFSIPKSTSKKKRQEMISGTIRPTKKPDTDNIAKVILDSLNKIAFDDDKQVVEMTVSKWYSEQPRVEVKLEGV